MHPDYEVDLTMIRLQATRKGVIMALCDQCAFAFEPAGNPTIPNTMPTIDAMVRTARVHVLTYHHTDNTVAPAPGRHRYSPRGTTR